ncbi:hypothetical protein BB560_007048 [Smittium megazygosporum]|uniref:Uncharacterized protein n=1 Tax=Smittium megazygosporum TaxID=133381 RepID=A0A2T9XZA9_9FUNG|nr:hypothetical protein BB560_007048 [Smittium megazygosporum]
MDAVNATARKLDLTQLLLAHTAISLVGALASYPSYNLPVFLYGLVVSQQSNGSQKQFNQPFTVATAVQALASERYSNVGLSFTADEEFGQYNDEDATPIGFSAELPREA